MKTKTLLTISSLLFISISPLLGQAPPQPAKAANIENLSELRQLSQDIVTLTQQVQPATVFLTASRASATGSGVVVSEDGLIYTAAHVMPSLQGTITATFPDGRRAEVRPISRNNSRDSGIMQITTPGKYPYVKIGDSSKLKRNDWVIALGHTGNYDILRKPPIRLGRITQVGKFIRTTATIASGDSGGPLFNTAGELIGIHSNGSLQVHINSHTPISVFKSELKKPEQNKNDAPKKESPKKVSLFHSPTFNIAQKEDEPTQDTPAEENEYEDIDNFFRQAKGTGKTRQLSLTPAVVKRLGGMERIMERYRQLYPKSASKEAPQADAFMQSSLDALSPLTEMNQNTTALILAGDKQIALGTVIAANGTIFTKYTETHAKENLTVRIADKTYPAKIQKTFPTHDLALLKIEAENLAYLTFHTDHQALGSLLVASNHTDKPLGFGVLSVQPRPMAELGMIGVSTKDHKNGALIDHVVPGSPAAHAGFKKNDLVTQIEGQKITGKTPFEQHVQSRLPGEKIKITYLRDGDTHATEATLGASPLVRPPSINKIIKHASGLTSKLKDGFPYALQHDIILKPDSCGGPLFNLDGKCIGINVSRAGRTKSFAIPSKEIHRILSPDYQPKAKSPEMF